jgi:hypothetical protein
MASQAKKSSVTLGGVPLAANAGIAWKFQTGTQPYQTVFSTTRDLWDRKLKNQRGKELTLKIVDGQNTTTEIKKVFILHEVASDSPHRASFLVSDIRWKWQYKLVARDYNLPRKTGEKSGYFANLPVELDPIIDVWGFCEHSLKDQKTKWKAKEAVEDVLKIITDKDAAGGEYKIDSWPIKEEEQPEEGEMAFQGVVLRDPADVALSRLLGYIPGAEIYIDKDGKAVVFNAADFDESDKYYSELPKIQWDGDHSVVIERDAIRPSNVKVYFQREVEVIFTFEDNYGRSGGSTTTGNPRDLPTMQNVIPTVDRLTLVEIQNPYTGEWSWENVVAGTWVQMDKWLQAMDEDRPSGSAPWTFETIRAHWLMGDLEGVLGAKGQDLDSTANVAMRVQALRQHFRQTFRINPRYVVRSREILPHRVATLDPISGTRTPASVWGQSCFVPSTKGKLIAAIDQEQAKNYKVFINVDNYKTPFDSRSWAQIPVAPATVTMLDPDVGVFRVDWSTGPYGLKDSVIPCNLVEESDVNVPAVVTRDLAEQDKKAVGAAMKIESGTNGIFLRDTLKLAVMMTVVPNAPNNERQFYPITVEASDISKAFQKEFGIEDGDGPTLEVFVPPGELTARFAWTDDDECLETVQDLLGFKSDDEPGLKEPDKMPGYTEQNLKQQLQPYANAYAAELLAAYADARQGSVVTSVPTGSDKLKLVGNVSSVQIRIGAYPSGKVDQVTSFPGQQRPLSKFAVLSEASRHLILGTVPFR